MVYLSCLITIMANIVELDVLCNLAERADGNHLPKFSNGRGVPYQHGRHPVVEQVLDDPFIANPPTLSKTQYVDDYPPIWAVNRPTCVKPH